MKNKVIALTLSAVLALSSTSAFAATTNCTQVTTTKYDFSSLLKNYNSKNVKYKVTVNGKTVDWNSLSKVNESKPVATKPEVQKPVATPAPAPAPAPTTQAPVENNNANTSVSAYEQKVVELVNVERQKAGLSALKLDTAMSNVARTKSKDMADNNYFAHQSPTYGSAGDMLSKFGIKWSAWGENIASGQKTPEAVVTAWMNSPGHRANILSSNYSRIGVGYVTNANGTSYWTQMFAN